MGYYAYAELEVSDASVSIFCTDTGTLYRTRNRLTELTGWEGKTSEDIGSISSLFSVVTPDHLEAYGTYRWLIRVFCEDGWEPIDTHMGSSVYGLSFKMWIEEITQPPGRVRDI